MSEFARALLLPILIAGCGSACAADTSDSGTAVWKTIAHDAGAYATAPIHWDRQDWTLFGASVLAVAAVHHYDDPVRHHFTAGSATAMGGNRTYEWQDAVPVAALLTGTFLYGALDEQNGGLPAARAMTESVVLAAVSNYVLKGIAGRARPNETADANSWRTGGSSFPSLHVAGAFAAAAAFAESGSDDSRWLTRTVGYGMAGFTSYQRLRHNEHWLSDIAAAAILGTATGLFVVHRAYGAGEAQNIAVIPMDRGVLLTYTLAFGR